MAAAHQHAHGAAPAARPRHRRGAGVADPAELRRSERRDRLEAEQPRSPRSRELPAALRRLHVGLVLGDLPAAVPVARGLRDPTPHPSPEGGPGRAAAHAVPPRAAARLPHRGHRGRPGAGAAGRGAAAAPPSLPGAAVRVEHRRRTRLPAGDRQPRVPRGPRRRPRVGLRGRRVHLHRPAGRRGGPDLRQRAAGVRLHLHRPLLRRLVAAALRDHARLARGQVRAAQPRGARRADRLHGQGHHPGAGAAAAAPRHQGERPAVDRRQPGLPARQRLRGEDQRPRREGQGHLRRDGAVPASEQRHDLPRRRQGGQREPEADRPHRLPLSDRRRS